ncbi:MAG: RNA methyltransferase, partial [Chloroflexota bacterium]
MDNTQKHNLVAYLSQFVTPHKKQLIKEIINLRTQHITVLLENIYQPHNASAVLRSCDCFGVQDVHIIEDENPYRINPEVAMGATKWLTLHRYALPQLNNTDLCLSQLKAQGYKIVATTLREGSISLLDFPIDKKIALCFGTEAEGLSEQIHAEADYFLQIPMYGFTQSYNISVSAALCLFELTKKLR